MMIINIVERTDYGVCVSMDEYFSLVLCCYLHSLCFGKTAISFSLSLPTDTTKSFSQSLYLFFFFAVMHHHYYRRMTTNNSKSDSPPPPSLVPSFNHHRFVSFGSTVSSIIDVTPIAVFSSFSSFSMLRPYNYHHCY